MVLCILKKFWFFVKLKDIGNLYILFMFDKFYYNVDMYI